MTAAFDLHANLIVVDTIIEGVQKRFVLDTGAAATVVDSEAALELGLEEQHRLVGRGAGGDVEMGMVEVRSIRVGDSEVRDLTCLVMDLGGLRERIVDPIDGILGYDFLSRFVLTIDYGQRALTLKTA